MFCSLSYWAVCYLGDLRSAYCHAMLVLNKLCPRLKWCRNKNNLRISQVTHGSMAQRAEHQILMTEILCSMFTGVIFCCWRSILLLLTLLCHFCVFVKNSNVIQSHTDRIQQISNNILGDDKISQNLFNNTSVLPKCCAKNMHMFFYKIIASNYRNQQTSFVWCILVYWCIFYKNLKKCRVIFARFENETTLSQYGFCVVCLNKGSLCFGECDVQDIDVARCQHRIPGVELVEVPAGIIVWWISISRAEHQSVYSCKQTHTFSSNISLKHFPLDLFSFFTPWTQTLKWLIVQCLFVSTGRTRLIRTPLNRSAT